MDADDYARLHGRLTAAVNAVCPAWMRDREDDLVQAGMMAVMRIESKGEEIEGLPTSYIRRVAYTALVDAIRRRRSRREVSLETMTENEMAPPTADTGPEQDLQACEIATGLRECLSLLVGARRNAVTLYLLGYKTPEVAARMGWKAKRASNLVYRGLDNLRACLRQRELTPE